MSKAKALSVTVTIPRGYTNAPYAEEFVDPVLGDYILSVDDLGDPFSKIDIDLYHKSTGNSVEPSSWTMEDYSVSIWFHLPTGQDVHVEVLPQQTVVSLWE
jgi:hypothetical protein